MSITIASVTPPPLPEYSRKAAVVGVGETDFHHDYEAARGRATSDQETTPESLAKTAFERALADAGLQRADIDGISTSFLYGGADPQAVADTLGLKPRRLIRNGGIMTRPLPSVCAAIAAGECDVMAMIYSVTPRTAKRQFGGQTYTSEQVGSPSSYYYYHPWGWSSQAAHWAFVANRYLDSYGATEEDLGAVAIQLRQNAMTSPHAVMRTPITIEDYMASRYIVRPLRLLDMCLVNDGAVCLIVSRSDLARDMAQPPVLVTGWGEAKVKNDKLHQLVRERLRPQLQDSAGQALQMAESALSDVQHFEGYDVASIHLVSQVEGSGLVPPGTGLASFRDGYFAPNGQLPVNTGGGCMSGSYMHGWSQVTEIVRQLRHQGGANQVDDAQTSMFCLAQTDQANHILFERGN